MDHPRTHPNDMRMVEALNFAGDADSVELKLTVPDTDQHSAITALDLDVLDAEFRQIVFFDTPDLALNNNGVVLRARRVRKGGDAVVKLRPLVPADLPRKRDRPSNLTIEIDVAPGAFVCSGSLKGKVENSDVNDVLRGTRAIRKLFVHEQRSLYGEYAPNGLDLDSLTPLGPITVAKLKFSPKGCRGRVAVAEVWFYPDGSRILELSTKCAPGEAIQVLTEMRAFLTKRGVTLTGVQEAKTHHALEYFSRLQTGKHKGASGRASGGSR